MVNCQTSDARPTKPRLHTITGYQNGLTVAGTSGNDVFAVSGSNATFLFKSDLGNDTINTFHAGTKAGHDLIDIDTSLAQSLSDLLFQQTGSDTLVTVGGHGSILVHNVAVADLQKNIVFQHHDLV